MILNSVVCVRACVCVYACVRSCVCGRAARACVRVCVCVCVQLLLETGRDVLAGWLDKKYGSGVTDNAIFSDLPRKWEQEFHSDMESLQVGQRCGVRVQAPLHGTKSGGCCCCCFS